MATQGTIDAVKKYLPLDGFTVDWPRFGSMSRAGDAVPTMKTLAALDHHDVQLYMNGYDYISELFAEADRLIAAPQGGIFWMHGWYFQFFAHDVEITLNGYAELPAAIKTYENPGGFSFFHKNAGELTHQGATFVSKIAAMIQQGVDVRILGWLNPVFFKSQSIATISKLLQTDANTQRTEAISFMHRNADTLYTILTLRDICNNDDIFAFDTMAHPIGGQHAKFVITGNATSLNAYIGGVDISVDRHAPDWPDATVKVQGPAARNAAEYFKSYWNELATLQVSRINCRIDDQNTGNTLIMGSHALTSSQSIQVNVPTVAVNNAHDIQVQLYKTLPRKNYTGSTKRRAAGTLAYSSLGLGIKKAVAAGGALTNLPDIWSPAYSGHANGRFEFKIVMYKAIQQAEKYIFIMDQSATNYELAKVINERLIALRANNQHLKVIILTKIVGAGGTLTAHDPNVVKFAKLLMNGIPRDQRERHFAFHSTNTHAKVVLIDDKFLSVGSANCMRRSFYTDFELGVGMVHETWVKTQRIAIWNGFVDSSYGIALPNDIDDALCFWNRKWYNVLVNNVPAPRQNAKAYKVTPRYSLQAGRFDSSAYEFSDPDSNSAI